MKNLKNFTSTISTSEGNYVKILNGPGTNKLINFNTKKAYIEHDSIAENIEATTDGDFKLTSNGKELNWNVSTGKLLDICTIKLSQQNTYKGSKDNINPIVELSLDEYMYLLGMKATKDIKDKARKRVKRDLEILYNLSIEWKEKSKKRVKDFVKIRIATRCQFLKGTILFSFSPEMASYLTNAYLMRYPLDLLKLPERNENTFVLGRKLALHSSNNNNIKRGTANIIGVKALLAVCKSIPSYEEVKRGNRAFDARIKAPFERALNALPFINWEYCNSKKRALTAEQLEFKDFNTFLTIFIKFEMKS